MPVLNTNIKRPVRSFVQREGRLTIGQKRALAELWPRFGVQATQVLDLDHLFGRNVPRTLEVGFGNGETLIHLAQQNPQADYLGIEMHRPGVGRMLLATEQQRLRNVRIIRDDAVQFVRNYLPAASIDRALVLFPDPWPKKRHHKRRLVQTEFVRTLAKAIKPGGHIEIATDWEPYAEHILEVMEQIQSLRNTAGKGKFSARPADFPETKFERRGRKLGQNALYLCYEYTRT